MRVLHVAQPTTAGVANVVLALAADQVRRGWSVHVACPDDGYLATRAAEVGATALSWPATRSPGPSVPRETRHLAALVRGCDPRVVHLHSSKAGLAGRLALRGRLPTVFQPHAWSFLAVTGPVRSAAVGWERLAARWAAAIAVVSETERALGEQAGVHGRWVRLPNGVDLTRFSAAGPDDRQRVRRELGLRDVPTVVCVGRLSRQKGQDLLLAAWGPVRAALPAASLVLVGDGPDRAALAGAAGEGVLLAGERSDVEPWLLAADVVVLPSRWEAGSLVAMEAMALARSVVGSDVAGLREAVGDDAGRVVPVGDVPALAAALLERLRAPELAAREGAAGRRRVEREHDLTVTTARAAQLYEQLLAR